MPQQLTYKKGEKSAQLLVNKKPICPWCEKSGNEKVIVFEGQTIYDEDDNYCGDFAKLVIKCQDDGCERYFVIEYYLDPNSTVEAEGYELSSSSPPQPLLNVSEVLQKWTLPRDVMMDLQEAASCMKNDLYQAFGSMARRTVHSICADKNAVGSDLQVQIEFLRKNGTFSNDVADRAQELRTFGRHGAHPEWERVDRSRAENGMELLVWVVKTVYQAPPPKDSNWRGTAKRRYNVPKK